MRCCRLPLCFWRLREAISCLQDCRTCWRRCKERAILRIIKICIYIYILTTVVTIAEEVIREQWEKREATREVKNQDRTQKVRMCVLKDALDFLS